VLALESTTFEPPAAAAPGAGGWRTLRFTAQEPGVATVRLAARRAGASPAPGDPSYGATIQVTA
jgi:hypothetical protein